MKVPYTNKPDILPEFRSSTPLFDPLYHSTRVLLGFTQGLFKILPKGHYRWSPNMEETEIIITDQDAITAESVAHTPAILTIQGQASFMNVAMHSRETVNISTGNQVHRDVVTTSITFNCISRNGVEASRLAWFLASQIKALRVFLQRNGPFVRIGHDVIIGAEQPNKGLVNDLVDGGAVNVVVSVPYFLPFNWEVREPAFIHDNTRVELHQQVLNVEDDTVSSFEIKNEVNNG